MQVASLIVLFILVASSAFAAPTNYTVVGVDKFNGADGAGNSISQNGTILGNSFNAIIRNGSTNDFTFDCGTMTTNWDNERKGAIIFRYTSASSFYAVTYHRDIWNTGNYIVRLKLNTLNSPLSSSGDLGSYTIPGGGGVTSLRVNVVGSSIQVTINGTLRINVTNSVNPTGSYGFGVGARFNTDDVAWNNVVWTPCATRTVGAASSAPTPNINTAMITITHATTNVTGISSSTGLPAGVTASYASNTISISGTPTASGIFNYTITPNGCGSATATGTITVAAAPITRYVNTSGSWGSNAPCYSTIQAAINASNKGDVIIVDAGTYTEALIINKEVTILGPNAAVSPNGGSRVAEAVINLTAGNRTINLFANNITIKGFEIKNSANAGAIMAGNFSGFKPVTGITIEKNYLHDMSGSAILCYITGSGTFQWTITDNKISNTTLATYFGGGYGSGVKITKGTNCSITNNVLTNIGFTGIDVWQMQTLTISGNSLTTIVDNGMQVVSTNSNLNITNNTITNANYPSATLGQGGIKLFGSPTNLSVTGNTVTGCGSAFAVEPNNNAAGASVNNNNFSGNTYGVYHAGTGTLNATCNWYGSTSYANVALKISGTVTFVSFLVSGTDNDLATSGFQPAPGTCTGVAVSTPTAGSSAAAFTSISQNAITFTFTKGNGSKRVIFVKAGAAISSNPVNDNSYTASSTFGNGTQLDNGYCVFNDTGNTVSVTGLNASTTYHFTVIEYNYLSSTIFYAGSLAYSSNATTLQPDTDNDGVADADDQYPNDQYKAFNNNFPAAGFGTLMYEDLWPGKGDYDFNDLVVDYRLNTITNADNNIVEMSFTFVTRAIGGSLHNGFAFQLDGINPSKITSVTGSKASGAQWISLNANGTEAGQTNNANILVFDDAYKLLPTQAGFSFVNVYEGSPNSGTDTTTIIVKFLSNGAAPSGGTLNYSAFNTGLFNPYLIVGQERGKEIHLADKVYTDKMNLTYLGKDQDRTNPSSGKYFKTADNLPWAINVDASIPFTKEKTDISEAYLKFIDWASSGGNSSVNWFLNLDGNRNNIKLMNR
jgi:LruC domain-containing protein